MSALKVALLRLLMVFKMKLNALKQENEALKKISNDFTEADQQLKEQNQSLVEKFRYLQWELTKARTR